jgi:hypothetical protein
MTSRLDIWNLASAHAGVKETITSESSTMLHAVTAAQFEMIALDIVLAEYEWSFANAEAALTIDNQEFTAIELTYTEISPPTVDGFGVEYLDGDSAFFTLSTDLTTGLAEGDKILITGDINGSEVEDYELYFFDESTRYTVVEDGGGEG